MYHSSSLLTITLGKGLACSLGGELFTMSFSSSTFCRWPAQHTFGFGRAAHTGEEVHITPQKVIQVTRMFHILHLSQDMWPDTIRKWQSSPTFLSLSVQLGIVRDACALKYNKVEGEKVVRFELYDFLHCCFGFLTEHLKDRDFCRHRLSFPLLLLTEHHCVSKDAHLQVYLRPPTKVRSRRLQYNFNKAQVALPGIVLNS